MVNNDTRIVSVYHTLFPAEPLTVTVADSTIPAGFPSPADDDRESLDIGAHIVRRPNSTFFMRVAGDSMTGAGIFDGDLLVVDRSLDPHHGNIVVAVVNGEFTVKRLCLVNGRTELQPENPKYRKILVSGEMEFEIWGVVTGAYKEFR